MTLQHFIDQPDGILLGAAGPQGDQAITTPSGRIELAPPHMLGDIPRLEQAISAALPPLVLVTDDIRTGVVSLPHGWGHGAPGARAQVAARHAGVNINLLSPGPFVDAASGNPVLNGIPVQVTRVEAWAVAAGATDRD